MAKLFPKPSRNDRGSPLGRRARRRAETHERILQAAFGLFARQGFSATTIEQITEAADVGKGTFFNYFPSKEHVLGGFATAQISRIQEALESAQQREAPVREILRRLLKALFENPSRSPGLMRALFVANLSSEAVHKTMLHALKDGRQRMVQLIALGQKDNEIRRDVEPLKLARFIQQSGFGALLIWSLHPSDSLDEWREATFDLTWSAIQNRAPEVARAEAD